MTDAGFEIDLREMTRVSQGYWKTRENRIEAIKWLVEKLGKPLAKITKEDFIENGLSTLINHYYRGSVYKAISDAGFEIGPEERSTVPRNYWKKEENRVKALEYISNKLNKPINQITLQDLKVCGYLSILKIKPSIKALKKEAQEYMFCTNCHSLLVGRGKRRCPKCGRVRWIE